MLNRAIEIAMQVAPTDVSVLISGESGVGKEIMPQIIHHLSSRKHNAYIAVNCGAIPEGTIDSELFGHEKGAFTGASDARKGYFEEADNGTIFLDEVGELPLPTQARLLRVLESGEFIRVGSSKTQKTNVRIVAATNVDMLQAVKNGKFREDLYYRLNSVPILIPPLRQRGEDIHLLFRKFSADFADKYHMPGIRLTEDAVEVINRYSWPGNIRQLKNITEQLAIIENERIIDRETLLQYIPEDYGRQTPMVIPKGEKSGQEESFSDREILYKVLFGLRQDVQDLKNLLLQAINPGQQSSSAADRNFPTALLPQHHEPYSTGSGREEYPVESEGIHRHPENFDQHEEVEESLSLADTEKELIQKALIKHNNKRKSAARELGISERTLYRKIKEYNIS